jgi:hypothetical protein
MISRVVASKCGIPNALICIKPSLGVGLSLCEGDCGGVVLVCRCSGDDVAPTDVNRLAQLPKVPLIARELLTIVMLSLDTDLVYINRNNGELIVFMVEHQSTITLPHYIHAHTLVRRASCVVRRTSCVGSEPA